MKHLSDEAKSTFEEIVGLMNNMQKLVINLAIDRLAAYEDTGLSPPRLWN